MLYLFVILILIREKEHVIYMYLHAYI